MRGRHGGGRAGATDGEGRGVRVTASPPYVIQQFVDEGLGNASYLVASPDARSAVVIDPLRDADRYLAAAKQLGVEVTYVLDTHLHADFVSGAREIAARTGATIGASADAGLSFEHQPLREGEVVRAGDMQFRVLATPGHTPEHIAFLLSPVADLRPSAVFTGGALIVGGAARTDLLGPSLAEPLARQLFHTLREKLLALPDLTNVYPTHGAGSFCIAGSTTRRTTTIGMERLTNPLLRPKTEDAFVQRALSGLPLYPSYFLRMREINRRGPRILGGLPALQPRSPRVLPDLAAEGVAILDVRPADAFAAAHIEGSYGIDLALGLAPWAGWLIPFGTPLVLLAETPEARDESVRGLIRIGYDDLRGFVEGGIESARREGLPIESIPMWTVNELGERLGSSDPPVVLDVRTDAEWFQGHIPGAVHLEAGRIPEAGPLLPSDRTILAHCVHGARSTAVAAVLARKGFRSLALLRDGVQEWASAGFVVERGTAAPSHLSPSTR